MSYFVSLKALSLLYQGFRFEHGERYFPGVMACDYSFLKSGASFISRIAIAMVALMLLVRFVCDRRLEYFTRIIETNIT